MRFQFQERPWDLIVILSYTLIVASGFLALNLGHLLSILLLLFAPGYVLVAYLFPWESKVDWLERLVLAFGLSLCVVPLLILTLNFTPFGIRPMTEIATIALFTTFVGLVAWRRRMQIPPGERLSMTVNLSIPRWKEYSM